MENKIYLKKYLIITLIIIIIFMVLYITLNNIEYQTYKKNFNNKINGLIEQIEKDYKDIDKNEIIKILNNESNDNTFLEKYGIKLII